MPDLDAIFKAYDIRGIAPDQLDADVARAVGEAFARFVAGQVGGATKVLVGRDMRASGVELSAAFADGVQAQGLDVVDLGLASTDLVYFAAGQARRAGRDVHGLPQPRAVQRHQALPRRRPPGRRGHRARARSSAMAAEGVPRRTPAPPEAASRSTCCASSPSTSARSSTPPCCGRSRSSPTPPTAWAGSVVPAVFDGLPFDLEIMYGELDGTFPNHPADPIQPENLRDLQARVLEVGADVGPRLRRRRRPGVPRRRARASRCRAPPPRRSSRSACSPRTRAPRSSTTASARRRCPRSSASTAARRCARRSATASSRR